VASWFEERDADTKSNKRELLLKIFDHTQVGFELKDYIEKRFRSDTQSGGGSMDRDQA
jgi:hypothetical protein